MKADRCTVAIFLAMINLIVLLMFLNYSYSYQVKLKTEWNKEVDELRDEIARLRTQFKVIIEKEL